MLLMKVESKICAANFDNSLAYVHWFWTATYKSFCSLQYEDVTVVIEVKIFKIAPVHRKITCRLHDSFLYTKTPLLSH